MYCDLLKMAFLAVPERFQVVACASKNRGNPAMIQQHQPTVAIISDSLEEGPLAGLKILPKCDERIRIRRIFDALGSSDKELVIEAFRLAADGVFCRSSLSSCCASRGCTVQGQIWANATELRYVMNEFTRTPKQRKVRSTVENRMTKREADVVRLAVKASRIARLRRIGLTKHTVKNTFSGS